MSIHLLPEDVAARIAAGEVVERPASVVKELVENSLDAGATRVEVETRGGGRDLIRVRDNGEGIPAAEVELAFRRHATSKLESVADLEAIPTLGFRGEALASIASVSRVTCHTRYTTEDAGTRLRIEGGEIVARATVGRPRGTELLIEDLFYNVPARRKFLRTERTERNHIDAFLTRYAIAYPHIAFSLVNDGREILATSGNGNAQEALLNVYGMDLGTSLLEIPCGDNVLTSIEDIQVCGFVGPTSVHRANRGYITLFINGRWVQDLRLTYAIIQAYHTLLPVKRFPVAFVSVTLPAQDVDVNVHPAKTEVRFRDGDTVFRAVQRAVRATVMDEAPVASAWEPPSPSMQGPGSDMTTRARLAALTPSARQITLPQAGTRSEAAPLPGVPRTSTEDAAPDNLKPGLPPATTSPTLPPLRVIGQAATMFIIAEGPEGIYLIDQHAAHERILYERLVTAWMQGQVVVQPLLKPEPVTLPVAEAAYLEELLPALHALGMEVESFGPGTFLVRSLPALLANLSPGDLLTDIASSNDEESPIHTALEEMIVRRICKRAAVKAGQVLSREEMERLVRDLERTANPRTCPHGRPTIVQIGVEQLIRQFGRG